MALTHDIIYQSNSVTRVLMHPYLRSLIAQHRSSKREGADDQAQTIEWSADQEPALSLDLAIPCGLLINELLLLSWPGSNIKLTLTQPQPAHDRHPDTEGLHLTFICDHTIFVAENPDTELQNDIVTALAEQMGGTASIEPTALTVTVSSP